MRFTYWFTVDRHGLRPRDDSYLKPPHAGFACWIGPFDQARCAQPLVPSHIRGLLAGRSETEAEAQGATAVARGAQVSAPSGAQGRPGVAPVASTQNPSRARGKARRVGHSFARVSILITVVHPFPHVAVHVEEAPRVGRVLAHVAGLSDVAVIIRIRVGDAVPP
jgi:hypothetical protein